MEKRYLFCPKTLFRRCLFTVAAALLSLNLLGQNSFTKQWEKSFGGKGDDFLWEVKATSDGGVIMGGSSNSGIEGGKSQPSRNFFGDIWVVKLDAQGNKQWDKTIGGNNGDEIRKVLQTADGGYVLFGESWSDAGGDKTEPCRGRPDFWLVRLDANGNKLWDKTYGGDSDEIPRELAIMPDGGFLMTGESHSGKSGDKTQGDGSNDYWLVKTDNKGNKIWDKTLEVGYKSEIRYFSKANDTGFLLCGFYMPLINAKSGKDSVGLADFWVIKFDAKGKEVWNKQYGTDSNDFLMMLEPTPDGGYILGGRTQTQIAGKEQPDALIIKLDGNGTKIWKKNIGGPLEDKLRTIQPTTDKGYIAAGYSGQKVEGSTDMFDDWAAKYYWVTKLDGNGNILWEEKYESPKDQLGYLLQTPDKGFLISGSYSRKDESQSEDDIYLKGEPPRRIHESWLTKLDAKGKKLWHTRIRRKEHHTYDTPELTKDGSFVLWGQEIPERDNSDYWIVKFGPEGAVSEIQTPASEKVYEKAEPMPVYPDGETALKAYFQKALEVHNFPSGGTVTLTLVINKMGQAEQIEVESGVNKEADALVLEAARKMPKWQPGKQKGQPVNVRMTIPVSITMKAQPKQNDVVDEKIYSFVGQQPEFPGCSQAMMDYIAKNIKYAADAQKNKIEGLVVLQFVVTSKGEIQDPKILKRLLPSLDAEAIRVVNSMPQWNSGKQNGRPVSVYYTLPIRFSLKEPVEVK